MRIIGFIMFAFDLIIVGAVVCNKQKELSQKGIKIVLAAFIGLITLSTISAFYLMSLNY